MAISKKYKEELFELFSLVQSKKEAQMLLEDILTPQEVEHLAERWQIVRDLNQGMSQRDIAKKLDVSISKITRGSRMLQYGSGGFAYFLKK